jgi:type II secretory pathway pseudopilin PulG
MHVPSPEPPRRSFLRARPHSGYSLVEVVIGLGIFSFAAAGLIALTLLMRSNAEEAVYHNTALTLAQGYIEQIRSSDYATIQAAATDATGVIGINLLSSSGAILDDESGGVLANGDWAQETVMLDETPEGEPKQPMLFRFRSVLTDLTAASGNTANGVEIVLHYETNYNFGRPRSHRGSLRTVRSNIPTY